MSKLMIDDIADLRAYERQRPEFRQSVISLKKKRRVGVGPHVTFLFENRDTIRFQIQEMARAEKILTDEGIQTELDVYNPLIPGAGRLAATMFIELTTEHGLREWLPRLVGIETEVQLGIGEGPAAQIVRCQVDPEHLKQLTRDEITASVHYVTFALDAQQVEAFSTGPVELAVTHPNYQHAVALGPDTVAELLDDLGS
jgi:hypothetical protein